MAGRKIGDAGGLRRFAAVAEPRVDVCHNRFGATWRCIEIGIEDTFGAEELQLAGRTVDPLERGFAETVNQRCGRAAEQASDRTGGDG